MYDRRTGICPSSDDPHSDPRCGSSMVSLCAKITWPSQSASGIPLKFNDGIPPPLSPHVVFPLDLSQRLQPCRSKDSHHQSSRRTHISHKPHVSKYCRYNNHVRECQPRCTRSPAEVLVTIHHHVCIVSVCPQMLLDPRYRERRRIP